MIPGAAFELAPLVRALPQAIIFNAFSVASPSSALTQKLRSMQSSLAREQGGFYEFGNEAEFKSSETKRNLRVRKRSGFRSTSRHCFAHCVERPEAAGIYQPRANDCELREQACRPGIIRTPTIRSTGCHQFNCRVAETESIPEFNRCKTGSNHFVGRQPVPLQFQIGIDRFLNRCFPVD